jgi:carboxypeptidase C (cathepsin A)
MLTMPAGVGFSYTPGAAMPYAVDDNATAAQNVASLLSFYAAFPEYSASPLWIAGESYAGVYVPMFAAAILASPAAAAVPLKGVLVGNGAVATGDWYEGGLVRQRMEHAYAHGLFSPALKARIDAACTNWTARPPACASALDEMADQMGPLNAYNIEVCYLLRAQTRPKLAARVPSSLVATSSAPMAAGHLHDGRAPPARAAYTRQ